MLFIFPTSFRLCFCLFLNPCLCLCLPSFTFLPLHKSFFHPLVQLCFVAKFFLQKDFSKLSAFQSPKIKMIEVYIGNWFCIAQIMFQSSIKWGFDQNLIFEPILHNKLRTRKILLQIEFHFNASSLIFNSFQFDRKYQNNHRQRQAIPNRLNASAKATGFVYAVVNHLFGSCPGVGNSLSWQKTNPGTEIHFVTSKVIMKKLGYWLGQADLIDKKNNPTIMDDGHQGRQGLLEVFLKWYILHHSVAAINYHHSSGSFVWRQLLKLIWGPSQLRNFAMRAICAAAIHYRGVSSYTLFFSVHVMIFSFSPFFAQKVMTSLKAAEICIILSISVCFVSALETPLCSFW